MWTKRAAQLLGLFGLYALVLARIGSGLTGNGKADYSTGLVELAAATIAFAVAAVFVVTRRPRARPPIE